MAARDARRRRRAAERSVRGEAAGRGRGGGRGKGAAGRGAAERASLADRRSSDTAPAVAAPPLRRARRARAAPLPLLSLESVSRGVCAGAAHGAERDSERSRGESNPASAREWRDPRDGAARERVFSCCKILKHMPSNRVARGGPAVPSAAPAAWRTHRRARRAELTPPARAWGKRSRRPGHSGWRGFLVRRLAAGSLRHGMHAAAEGGCRGCRV